MYKCMFFLLFLTLNLFASDIAHNKVLARYTHPTGFEIKKADVDKFSYWKVRPDVRICTHAPVTVQRVKEALNWWKKRGYSFGYVYRSNCVSESDYGTIIIDLAGQEFNFEKSYGSTSIKYDKDTGKIHWAKIYLPENVRERVLEHEIGHALGWDHSSKRGHILYPIWQAGGWDDEGLKVPALNLTRQKSFLRIP